ncbi:MAG: hypothetical protein JWO36_5023, partial [Myxococcales bacterium]|nr:hypothetical protein [Myxococcales bacterium]
KQPHPPVVKAHPPVAAANDQAPKALTKKGAQLEAAGDWYQARGFYMKLEKIPGYSGIAVYKQAWAAFQANDTDAALALAQKAAGMSGAQKMDAKFLYADALYRHGDFDRAKNMYIGLRKVSPADKKSQAAKKIAACNRMLKLPEADGVVD